MILELEGQFGMPHMLKAELSIHELPTIIMMVEDECSTTLRTLFYIGLNTIIHVMHYVSGI